MMNVAVLGVGRLRERYYREAADEYVKRLGRYLSLEEVEIPDSPEPKRPSEALDARVMDEEGARLLARIRPGDHVIALCIEGQACSSEQFAEKLEARKLDGTARLVFVIGGSLGLSRAVRERAQEKLSFSPMTFPHQLARVMLLEQLYRACKLNAGERYHK